MVFFKKEMERAVMVHPQFLGRNLLQHVKDQLVSEVQGMSLDDAGFIIAVLRVNDEMQRGVIDHLTGFVKYRVAYSALMFRPFKNEVLDATVKAVSDVGFFAEAGPLSIFVSRVHIPLDMEYNADNMSFSSPVTAGRIKSDSKVRVKIIGSSVQSTTLCAIASINDAYLGLLE